MALRIPESETELINLIYKVAKIANMESRISTGELEAHISRREAKRRYKKSYNQWKNAGLFTEEKTGGRNHKIKIDSVRLETINAVLNDNYR